MPVPKYDPQNRSFAHRLAMCSAVNEGSELGDAIRAFCHAASAARSASADMHQEMALLLAEELCRDHVNWLRHQGEWEEYNECHPDVYAHFTRGARKLSKEEFERSFLRE